MTDAGSPPEISESLQKSLLQTLKTRFEKNMHRHKGLLWEEVRFALEQNPERIKSLLHREQTGGEPDVVDRDKDSGKFIFCDCATESPLSRRSLCYDQKALQLRKDHQPGGSALEMAARMGIELLSAEQYRHLQHLEAFDTKTSSWLKTSTDIREKGGALFGDYRYGHVFVYHNGAQSYYAARGFRGMLRV
ncbi:MAG: DUF4256 domain-containing protein [Bacteroidota bacterium]